ncbi:acyl-CoA dehydrogenase family protein [Kitasatospora sp. NPDC101176]|uniref:acyl-CoA dehydrogenase family protein n=1 Tax=Kitasatospora sp. NPDC101176 TaxID=3364099 RepID=UPI00381734AE
MADALATAAATVRDRIGDRAGGWDLAGVLPLPLLRELGAAGVLCAQLPEAFGGLGLSSLQNGELTAGTGRLCSSVRSVQTSQGMAAWTVQRFGLPEQQRAWLPDLASGRLAAVGFSETGAGSDLAAMATTVRRSGDELVVDGHKRWMTAARYADLLVVFGRYEDGAAAVLVPADAPGVHVEPVADPMGCRAAGHADVRLDGVRLPAGRLLGGSALPLPLLVTTALAYGRMSVAWGCVGILRACLEAASRHAATREQFGQPIGRHQLVAGHLADLLVAEQVATRVCEHASRCWDAGSAEQVIATVLAKQVASEQSARAAATAVQVLASAGARDGGVAARAYRDAKLMEIIEGSSELCRLLLADHALAVAPRGEEG